MVFNIISIQYTVLSKHFKEEGKILTPDTFDPCVISYSRATTHLIELYLLSFSSIQFFLSRV